ncbi:MAG: hypothetical protein AB1750_06730 [Chloroflexota bacterium]
METPIEQPVEENPDHVPLSIKVIVAWLYVSAVLSLLGIVSFREGRTNIDLPAIILVPLTIWSAYHLGYRRNFARVIAIGIVGWQIIVSVIYWIYVGWQAWRFWLANNRIFFLTFDFMGQELKAIPAIAYFVLITVINVYTFVTLLQPHIREMFSPTKQVASEK